MVLVEIQFVFFNLKQQKVEEIQENKMQTNETLLL